MHLNRHVAIALEVRDCYAQMETKAFGRSWSLAMRTAGLHGDTGDLVKLLQASLGWRSYERRVYQDGPQGDLLKALKHELADCLWSLIVIADGSGGNPIAVVDHALRSSDDPQSDLLSLALKFCAATGSLAEFARVATWRPMPSYEHLEHPWQGTLETAAHTLGAIARAVYVDLATEFEPAMRMLLTRAAYDPTAPPTDPIIS